MASYRLLSSSWREKRPVCDGRGFLCFPTHTPKARTWRWVLAGRCWCMPWFGGELIPKTLKPPSNENLTFPNTTHSHYKITAIHTQHSFSLIHDLEVHVYRRFPHPIRKNLFVPSVHTHQACTSVVHPVSRRLITPEVSGSTSTQQQLTSRWRMPELFMLRL